MIRIMFDSSVYGKLIFDEDILKLVRSKFEKHEFIIYGASAIRKELRDTPRYITYEKSKVRLLLLSLYDSFVRKDSHDLKHNKLIDALAKDYFKEYKLRGGALSDEAIKNDLTIIATATIYQLDIIVSDDERTMLSERAVSAYKNVNKGYGLKDPIFKNYSIFKQELTR